MTEQINSNRIKDALPYVVELRRRLLICIAAVIIIFCVLFPFAQKIYHVLALPLVHQLPNGASLIATGVVSPFLIPLKLIAILSLFLTIPIFFYHLWAFINPALYLAERRWLWSLLCASTGLFYLGISFVYWVIFPLLFRFLLSSSPPDVNIMPDISQYLDFVLHMFLAFGLVFEVPLIVVLVICTGITTAEKLVAKRPYIIVGAFIIGMLFTPPDVLSQILLAVPLWLLFEAGIFIAIWITKCKK